jgi:hypothetical protein
VRVGLLRLQVVLLACLTLGIAALVFAGLGSTTPSAWKVVNADEELSDQVSFDEDLGVYLVERGSRVIALSNRGPWNNELVTYCKSSELFETSRSGSKFDKFGRYLYGPAPRGLSRYTLRESDDELQLYTGELIPGPSRAYSKKRALAPVGMYCIPI